MGRREQVLDAAVEVLGLDGIRRLTYQAVDTRADVPAGTTSNHFRNRDQLLDGIVGHLEALDRADWEAVSTVPATSADGLTTALVEYVRHATGPGRARNLARYQLFLETPHRQHLRESLRGTRDTITVWAAEALRGAGSATPQRHTVLLLDYLDGLLLHQIVDAQAEAGLDPTENIHTLLSALLTQPEEPR